MNNKHDSVRIYSICWSQLYLFLNSTTFLTMLTKCSEIGPLIWPTFKFDHGVRTSGRGTLGRERPGSENLPLRPKTVPWNYFCLFWKWLLGIPWPPSFTRGAQQIGAARCSHVHMVMCMSKCCCLYSNSYCVYTSLYVHALTFLCTCKNTCHFIRTLQWLSKV